MKEIKCHIADGHFLVKEGLKHLLCSYPHIKLSREASTFEELKNNLNYDTPDVLIVDHRTLGLNSMLELRTLIECFPNLGVLDISDIDSRGEVVSILNTGIQAILLKECDEEEIIDAITAACKGERFFCGNILDMLNETGEHTCEPVLLSQREIEVMGLIADGLTSKNISEKLYLSLHTVNTHRKNILKKLNIKSSSELVNYAFKIGIREVV